MKYNWVDYLKVAEVEDVELALPENPPVVVSAEPIEEERNLDLEIIKGEKTSIIENMTKQQVAESCLSLYKKQGLMSGDLLDIAVGSCVVSNYKDAIQNTKKPAFVSQTQLQLIEKECQRRVNTLGKLTEVEKQLSFGVCVSDGKLN